jgi:antitoxin ParD1/3/4/toxin ParE1/3/4
VARPYRVAPEAQRDLIEIRAYYREVANARTALYVVDKITAALLFLAKNPGAGHTRQDLTAETVKFWPVLAYLIVYIPEMTPLGIARVLHASRDLQAIFLRRPLRAW